MNSLFKDRSVLDKNGSQIRCDQVLNNKVVGLLFGASWVPKCKEFVTQLTTVYTEWKANNFPIEILFMSSDFNEEEMMKSFKEEHGNWLAVPYNSSLLRSLKNNFQIEKIPKLIIIKSSSLEIITEQGTKEVTERGAAAGTKWINLLKSK
ncbi:hypothetical protein SNEBB_004656 [Seison nebaliae]|nr:hypothetical protein SNEBB_004656 [Seison nebaliae]